FKLVAVFDTYEKARLSFVQTVSDLATKPLHVDCLIKCGVLDLLIPLLSDPLSKVQQCTAVALGRLVNNNRSAAEEIIRLDIFNVLLRSIDRKSKFYKKSAMYVLRGLAKYSTEMADRIVQAGGLISIMVCLEDFDPEVKEAAAWTVGYIAKHTNVLAQACVASGAIQLLKMCLQEPELCLKQIAVSAMGDIAKHSADLAQTVVDSASIPYIVKCFLNPDPRLKRQALCCLSNVAKHTLDLAEIVVEAEVFPNTLVTMGHPDQNVSKNAAILTKEVVKHHLQLAQLVVNSGGLGALIHFVSSTEGSVRLPGVLALGYIASQSEQLSLAFISLKGVSELAEALKNEPYDHVRSAIVWSLGQVGKHSAEHAKELALANVFTKVIELYVSPQSSLDLKQKCKGLCRQSLTKCLCFDALEPLLISAPPEILKYILGQFSKILPNDAGARRMFVLSGSLKKVQEIEVEPGSTIAEYITIINYCFPEEIIRCGL
ncbi:hypothetical protein AAG570_002424, partial [Ranatra chinensis]